MEDLHELFVSILDGSYKFFAPVALIVIVYRICKSKWTSAESIVLGTVILHLLLEIVQTYSEQGDIYVSKRYLLPCAPLLFGWTAYGVIAAWQWLSARLHRNVMRFVVVPLIGWHMLVLIWDGAYPSIKTRNPNQANGRAFVAAKHLAPLIEADYQGPKQDQFVPDPLNYQTGRRPLIVSDYPVVAYLCKGSNVVSIVPGYDYMILPGDATPPPDHTLKFSVHEGKADFKVYVPARGNNPDSSDGKTP